MSKKCVSIAGAVLVSFSFIASSAFAPDPAFEAKAKGFQQNHDYFSLEPFEHVDTLSGNLVLAFADLTLPGNGGRPLRFQRTYNSRFDSPGWHFGFADVVMSVADSDPTGPPYGTVCEECYLPHLFTADGADHTTIWLNQPNFGPDGHRWVVTAQF